MEGKNPISFLQEYMVKFRIQPEYSIVDQKTGTHMNEFTVKLVCGTQWPPAVAKGFSKKEAKLKAALAMLQQIKIIPNSIKDEHETSFDLNGSRNALGYLSDSSIDSNISVGSNFPTAKSSTPSLHISWINALQEEVVKKNNDPHSIMYDTSCVGLSHNPNFTTICTYKSLSTKAQAFTKKESKNLAAKKMYELFKSTYNNINKKEEDKMDTDNCNAGNFNLVLENACNIDIFKNEKLIENLQTDKAIRLYSKMNNMSSASEKPNFAAYYEAIKNDMESKKIMHLEGKLVQLLKVCQNSIHDSSSFTLNSEPIQLLQELLISLQINMKTQQIYTKQKCLYSIALNTTPRITEIGVGKNEIIAQNCAVFHITYSLLIILQ